MNKQALQPELELPTGEANALPVAQQQSMMGMIERLASDPAFDADKLEKLLAMKERLDKEDARKAFNKALRELQAVLPEFEKTRDGLRTNSDTVVSRYMPLDQMLYICRPYMRQFGFSHRFQTLLAENKIRCYLMHELGHEEFSEFPLEQIQNKLSNKAQELASGQSYAQRYCFKAVLGIVEKMEDTDGIQKHKIDDAKVSKLTAIVDELDETRRTAAMGWLAKRGFGAIEDITDTEYPKILEAMNAALEKQGGSNA